MKYTHIECKICKEIGVSAWVKTRRACSNLGIEVSCDSKILRVYDASRVARYHRIREWTRGRRVGAHDH